MKLKYIYLLAGAFMLTVFASCKKNLLNINTNPSAVTANVIDPNVLLTEVQVMYTGSGDDGAENWATEWGGISGYIQHCASLNTGYYYGDKYLYSPGNTEVYFTHAYIYQVQPLIELYELTANKPQYRNLHQMARIMRALVFQRLTDMYGDVPYSQAGLGYYGRIYTPVYDTQQSIYTDMLKEVSQATDSLDVNADQPSGDVFFANSGSEIPEWQKLGNSLLLRIAMRLTKVDPATAQTYVKQVLGHTMTSVKDNAIVEHDGVTRNRDAWSLIANDQAELKWCKTFIDSMKRYNDPRVNIFAELISGDKIFPGKSKTDTTFKDQVGLPPGYIVGGLNAAEDISKSDSVYYFGLLGGNAPTSTYYATYGQDGYSQMSSAVLNYTAPNLIVTYSETELLLADAEVRWGITDAITPKQHFINGVQAAEEQLAAYGVTINEPAITAYVNAMSTKYDQASTPDAQLDLINTQYWLCTVYDEYEAWANWRRTSTGTNPDGYPKLIPTIYTPNNGGTGGTIPRRLDYPIGQKVTNGVNYNAAVARLKGGDHQTSRMWWDQ